jgi:diamine N-acetyltransferase
MSADSSTPHIRPATLRDADALAALGRQTFTDAFGADNTPEDLARFLDEAYGPGIQARELVDPALVYLVAERGADLVAFALLRTNKTCPFVDDPTAIELQRIYLDTSCHGTGLAQRLMAECIAAAETRGARTLFLGVWERNAKALRFYAAQGFTEVGTQIFQVGSDPQQDLVLARPLTPR